MEIKKEPVEKYLKVPEIASARIYVGGLTSKVKEDHLREKFSKHGVILDILHTRGYAIIQYVTEYSAQNAIENENKTKLVNKRITVKLATLKSENGTTDVNGSFPIQAMKEKCTGPPTGNDIVIIALTKNITSYAESIEREIEKLGFTVDIFFKKEKFSLFQLIDSLPKEDTYLALVIGLENSQELTVDVHYVNCIGNREKMSVEKALHLIKTRFRPKYEITGGVTSRLKYLSRPL